MNETNYWDDIWSKQVSGPANNFARRAYQIVKARNLNTLLDFGCGGGRDSIYFSRRGLKVTAIDFSEIGISKVKSRDPNIRCILGNLRDAEFQEKSFDIIYSHLSLHYFDDKTTSRILDNLYKYLIDEGLIFIKCKSIDDDLYGKGEKIGEDLYNYGHLRHFFSKEYMAEKLSLFKIIKVRKTSSRYHGIKSSFIEAIATK